MNPSANSAAQSTWILTCKKNTSVSPMNHCYHKLPTAVAKVAALGSAPGAKDFKVKND